MNAIDADTVRRSEPDLIRVFISNEGRTMIFAVKREGKVIGAIGVSGGSGEQYHAVAEAKAANEDFRIS